MQRLVVTTLLASVLGVGSALADPLSLSSEADEPGPPPVRLASARGSNLGGGFIEFLFGDGDSRGPRPVRPPGAVAPYDPDTPSGYPAGPFGAIYGGEEPLPPSRYGPRYPSREPDGEPYEAAEPARPSVDPKFRRQVVDYRGKEQPGTVVIDTRERLLYLVQGGGKALRYGIGVGRPGFTWAGVKTVSAKREWPDWRPPDEMLKRRPDLPRYMPGGPSNPLGARAMYLGSSLYRIHGSNEPWTIGTAVSSGCIRMRNEDVIDLYGRVKVGTKVVVI